MSPAGHFFVKMLLAVLVIGVIAPFTVIKGPDGGPLMSWRSLFSSWPPSWLYKLENEAEAALTRLQGEASGNGDGGSGPKSSRSYYISADNGGRLVFSQLPPRDGRLYVEATHAEVATIQSMTQEEIASAMANAPTHEAKEVLVVGEDGGVESRGRASAEGSQDALQQNLQNAEAMLNGESSGGLTTVNPADIPTLIEAARQIQRRLEQRAQQQAE